MNTITVQNASVKNTLGVTFIDLFNWFLEQAMLDNGLVFCSKPEVRTLFFMTFPGVDFEQAVAQIVARGLMVTTDSCRTLITLDEQRRREQERAKTKVDREAERARMDALVRHARTEFLRAARKQANPNAPAFLTKEQVESLSNVEVPLQN